MGQGLKRVAALCGGLVVTAGGKTVKYNSEGEKVPDQNPDPVCADCGSDLDELGECKRGCNVRPYAEARSADSVRAEVGGLRPC